MMYMQGSRISLSKINCFGILINLSCRYLEISKVRNKLSLNSPYLPKDRSSKRNSIVKSFLPWSFINNGRLTLVIGEKIRSQGHTQILSQLLHLPSILVRALSSFLKINTLQWVAYIPPPLCPLRWHLSVNCKPHGGVTHFSLDIFYVYIRYTW